MASGFGDVVLLGIGSSTKAAAAYLLGLPEGAVSSVTVYGGSAPREAGEALEALGVRVVWDSEELDRPYDLAVSSPGLPCSSPLYQSAVARCAEVVSEPELAWRESPRDWVAVTGTNGKTTTTSLVRHLFEEAGRPVRAVGNIGLRRRPRRGRGVRRGAVELPAPWDGFVRPPGCRPAQRHPGPPRVARHL